MDRIAIQVHARHPIAAVQYGRLLSAHKDIRVVSGEQEALIGILDGEPAWIEDALRSLLQRFPLLRPLVLSPSGDEEECRRSIRLGVWGLVTYDRYKAELLPAIHHLAEGRLWFPAPVVLRWAQEATALWTATPHLPLTPREHEVMIRNAALAARIPIMTTVRAAQASANGIRSLQKSKVQVRSLQEYHAD